MLWGGFAVLGPGWLFGCLLSHFKICFNDVVCICCVYLTHVSVTNVQKKKTNKQKQIRMWTFFCIFESQSFELPCVFSNEWYENV